MERKRPQPSPPRSGPTPGKERGTEKVSLPPGRIWMLFLGALLVNFLAMRYLLPATEPVTIPYTAFKEQVAKRNVSSIYSRGESIEGRFAKPIQWPPPGKEPADGEA